MNENPNQGSYREIRFHSYIEVMLCLLLLSLFMFVMAKFVREVQPPQSTDINLNLLPKKTTPRQ